MSTDSPIGEADDQDDVLLEEYLKDARLQGLADTTLDVYESNLESAFEFFDGHPHSIGRDDLKDLLFYLKNEHPARAERPESKGAR